MDMPCTPRTENPYANPDRTQKLVELRRLGVDPFPAEAYLTTHSIGEVDTDPETFIAATEPERLSGRLFGLRGHGGVIFADLVEEGVTIQAMIRRNEVSDLDWQVMGYLDVGDFVGIEGQIMRTNRGQLTIQANQIVVLGKASLALPIGKQTRDGEFHDALADTGARNRQRHVSLITDPGFAQRIRSRSSIMRSLRHYFEDEGFIEVETPILGTAYGGAAARPFETHANALDQDMYLRISPETNLKRAQCGDLPKIVEFAKNFRNEGIDSSHNPEFSMMEWYEKDSDYLRQMERFETVIPRVAEELTGSTRVTYQGRELQLAAPWTRLPVLDALEDETGLDLRAVAVTDMAGVFREFHPHREDALAPDASWGQAVMELFEAIWEPRLWQPTFVMDHPVDVSPLTKRHRSDPLLVERFEPHIASMEIGNSYSELNDPWEQWERLANQQGSRDEHYDLDHEFMQAMAHGMPQAGGSGLGIDRLVMLLTDAPSIRDVILFPLVTSSS